MAPLEILICGTGVAGPTLATFLLLSPLPANQRPHITLLERAPTLRPQGQNIDIRGIGVPIIRKLGLEKLIRASTTGEAGVKHVDANNRAWASLQAMDTEKVRSPTSDIEILRGRLADILYRRSLQVSDEAEKEGGKGVQYLFGDYIESLDQTGDKVRVRFAKSKETRSFDLVVGADGLQSRTRALVWGEGGEQERLHRIGMHMAFFKIPKAGVDDKWRRWYHAPGRRGIMLRPDDTGEKTTVLMSVMNDGDQRLKDAEGKGSGDVQKKLMQEYFDGAGWESDRVIREMWKADDFYYDMVGQVKMESWTKGRVALLGDAGYCASPLSGMGTTLAMVGAYNLAGALTEHPDDFTAAFAQYEEKMHPVVEKAQKLAPGMPWLLNPETSWGLWIMSTLLGFISWSNIGAILFKFMGPPADAVKVDEYGFKQLPEWTG